MEKLAGYHFLWYMGKEELLAFFYSVISFPDLSYPLDALEPHISRDTMELHYHKHHRGYFTTLCGLIQGTPYEGWTLPDIIQKSWQKDPKVFNNGAQVWNHSFFWESLSRRDRFPCSGSLYEALDRDFGGKFLTQFVEVGMAQFGSGWVWLAKDRQGKLSLKSTSNGEVVWLTHGLHPLLVCDVWEHAYYVDYQNRRAEYLEKVGLHLLHWDFAQQQYEEPFMYFLQDLG